MASHMALRQASGVRCSSGAAARRPAALVPPTRALGAARLRVRAAAEPQQQPPAAPGAQAGPSGVPPLEKSFVEKTYPTEFGYTRKDIFLLGGGLIGLGYAMYYGLQALGMEPGMAGNWVQLVIFLGICVGWVSTYLYRVATKQMTYAKQLEMYEEAVMRKRMEEMTEAEVAQLMSDVETERARRGAPRGGSQPTGGSQ